MRYMGSKNKISKDIVPIIQKYINDNNVETYIEGFVGGANIIDKINCKRKIGNDINKYLIELFKHVQININDLPECCLFEHYKDVRDDYNKNGNKYEDWHKGFIGFCASYGGRFFDGGYARNSKDDINGDWSKGAISNLIEQSKNLKNIEFYNKSFLDIDINKFNNCLFYLDPPYKGTKQYKFSKDFLYEKYYDLVRKLSKNNIVICSEYNMPNDFICIWEKENKTLINSKRENGSTKIIRTEKLFIYEN